MQLHQLKPRHKARKIKRVGRGGKRGTYSGRGLKGQKSRAGRKLKPSIRELIKRYPKLRGYRFRARARHPKYRIIGVNVGILDKKFSAGEIITPQILAEKRIIRRIKGRMPNIKLLAEGEITKPLSIKDCLASKSALKKIEAAGGNIQLKR